MAVSPDLFSASSSLLLCAEDADDFSSWEEEEDEEAGGAAAAEEQEWDPPALDDGRSVVASLFAAEPDHLPRPDYLARLHACAIDAAARHDAVDWILKVNEFYRFRSVTTWLAVNYLDRFLSSHSLPGHNGNGGWPMQLLSVACVSVAAKMEETHVPLLLDLQILDPPFEFEPRTIRRMELLLASALRWRLRAVTPFDFLHHLAAISSVSALSSSSATPLLSRAAHIILRTHRLVDFLGYPPSAIAVASFLCAAGEVADSSAGDNGDLSSCFEAWVGKEVVNRCRQLMEDYVIGTCPSVPIRREETVDRGRRALPTSPVAVLDSAASCLSYDTAPRSDDGHPQPDPQPHCTKRRRLREHPCTERVFSGLDGNPL